MSGGGGRAPRLDKRPRPRTLRFPADRARNLDSDLRTVFDSDGMSMMRGLACSCVLLCFVAAIVCFGARSVRADELKVGMVIGTDVVCRAQPSSSARAETRLRLGDYLGISKEIRAGGATWYFDEWHV